jgi:hypothetical protein
MKSYQLFRSGASEIATSILGSFACVRIEERTMPYGDFPDVLTLKKGRALHDAVDALFGELLERRPVDTSLEAILQERIWLTDRLAFLRRTTRDELIREIDGLRSYALTPLLQFLDVDLLTKHVVDYSIEFSIEDMLG